MPVNLRSLGDQVSAYVREVGWLEIAQQANASATQLADVLTAAGAELAHPTDGNEVFVTLPPGLGERLKAAGAGFYPWIDGSHRFVCSWATEPDEIRAFSDLLGIS